MIKWLNWLSKLIVMTVLVSGLTVYITWTTVHLYVERLLGQFPLSANMKKLQFSDLWDQMIGDWKGQDPVAGNQTGTGSGSGKGTGAGGTGTGTGSNTGTGTGSGTGAGAGAGGGTGANGGLADSGTGRNASGGDTPVNGSPAGSDGGSGAGLDGTGGRGLDAGTSGSGTGTGAGAGSGGTGAGGTNGLNGGRGEYVPDNALPVFGQSSGADSDALDKKKLIMTAEQFNQKRELLSDADKMRIFTLLLARLPEEELQTFSQMVEDGISSDDLTVMDQAAQKYLKPEEYDELMDILKKME